MDLICTFSNPFIGPIKSSIHLKMDNGEACGTAEIRDFWKSMDKSELIRESSYGCYKESDRHLTFVWKDTDIHW